MRLITLSTLLATTTVTSEAPTKRDTAYHGMSLWWITDITSSRYIRSPRPVEINNLVDASGSSASSLAFSTTAVNIDITKVKCRAFSDAEGVVPLGKPFNFRTPLFLDPTELVPVGSVLCYVVTDEEAAKF